MIWNGDYVDQQQNYDDYVDDYNDYDAGIDTINNYKKIHINSKANFFHLVDKIGNIKLGEALSIRSVDRQQI